jgi:hypothetical protein
MAHDEAYTRHCSENHAESEHAQGLQRSRSNGVDLPNGQKCEIDEQRDRD